MSSLIDQTKQTADASLDSCGTGLMNSVSSLVDVAALDSDLLSINMLDYFVMTAIA